MKLISFKKKWTVELPEILVVEHAIVHVVAEEAPGHWPGAEPRADLRSDFPGAELGAGARESAKRAPVALKPERPHLRHQAQRAHLTHQAAPDDRSASFQCITWAVSRKPSRT